MTEMLVVVVIVLVIMTFALPGFDYATATAQTATCATRLRQIHIACMGFAADNDGTLPHLKRTYSGLRLSYSDDIIGYLLADSGGMDTDGNGQIDGDPKKDFGFDLFRCPGAEPVPPQIGSHDQVQILDYGVNHYGYDAPAITPPALHWPTMSNRRVNAVGNPSVVYFADADARSSPEDIGGLSRPRGAMEWPVTTSFEFTAYIRHQQGHNIVQLDGAGMWYTGLEPQNPRWFIRRR